MTEHYRTICGNTSTEVTENIIGIADLSKENFFDMSTQKCLHCGCIWQFHMGIRYKTELVKCSTKDESIVTENKKIKNETSQLTRQIYEIGNIIRQNKLEYDLIIKHIAKLASFLHNNVLLLFNDSCKEYIGYLIDW